MEPKNEMSQNRVVAILLLPSLPSINSYFLIMAFFGYYDQVLDVMQQCNKTSRTLFSSYKVIMRDVLVKSIAHPFSLTVPITTEMIKRITHFSTGSRQ